MIRVAAEEKDVVRRVVGTLDRLADSTATLPALFVVSDAPNLEEGQNNIN